MITPVMIFGIRKNSLPCDINKQPPAAKSPSVKDSFSPSFCSAEFQERFLNELQNLNGIRCPRCNKTMLSEDKYNNILEQFSQVKNGQELEKIIENNQDYLSDSNALILKDLKYINTKYPDADIATVITKIHEHAPLLYRKTCEQNINLIELVTQKLQMNENDKKVYLKTADKLKSLNEIGSYDFKEFSTTMNDTLKQTDYSQKRKLFDKIMRHQSRAYNYYKNISKKNLAARDTQDALNTLCEAIFKRSESHVRNISREDKFKHTNKILLCGDCTKHTENLPRYYKNSDDEVVLKYNFIQYLQDLNKAVKNGELHVDSNYLNNLIKHVKYSSNKKIELNAADMTFFKYKKSVEHLPFDSQEGIPCPKCKAIMLTHSQKERLSKQILETDTIKGLYTLVKENEKYLPPVMKRFAEKFKDTYIRDPYITDKLMQKEIQKFSIRLSQQELSNFVKLVDKRISNPDYSQEEKEKLKAFKTQLISYSYTSKKFFDIKKLGEIVKECNILEPDDKFNIEIPIETTTRNLELLAAPAFHSPEVSKKYNNWSKLFVSRIFQKAVFTQDHMIARNNGGTDELNNKMGLHRECNIRKSKKSFKQWFNEDPKIVENSRDYFNKINELASENKIKNCDNYSSDITYKIYLLTGNPKLKNEFHKKDTP